MVEEHGRRAAEASPATKDALRKLFRAHRDQMDETARELESRAVCACVREIALAVCRGADDRADGDGTRGGMRQGTDRRAPGVLAVYQAFGSELDLAPLVRALAELPDDRHPSLALPASLPGGRMEFVGVSPAELLHGGQGGPDEGDTLEFIAHPGRILRELPTDRRVYLPDDIAAMVVPGLAFDRVGRRLGYGAGYYDAYLARCRADGATPVTVGVCFSCQLSERSLPCDERDMPVDMVVVGRGGNAEVVAVGQQPSRISNIK